MKVVQEPKYDKWNRPPRNRVRITLCIYKRGSYVPDSSKTFWVECEKGENPNDVLQAVMDDSMNRVEEIDI